MPFINAPTLRLHYLDEGDGPPVVWLPGGNDCAALMLHAHRRLTSRVRLVCLDPRGHGESDAPTTADDYSPDNYAGDVLALVDALGLERAVIGGHSRGGRTSVEFALRYPERVVGVIAAASPLLGSTSEREPGFRRYQRALAAEGVDAFLSMLRSGPRHPERHAIWRAAAHRAGAQALIAQYEALSRLGPLTDRLPSLAVPGLFLTGDRDFLRDHAERAAAAGPRVRFALIPDAGHALFADNPRDYFDALNGFLDECLDVRVAAQP
jgi:pimeloyl-ACP methyl ester carboxylesterase